MGKQYNLMSNAEIKIHLMELENEYEAIKCNVQKEISRMQELDNMYIKANTELNKRIKGTI
jgi:hypothetical protein